MHRSRSRFTKYSFLHCPFQIVRYLDLRVHGQEQAKRDLAATVYSHYLSLAAEHEWNDARNPQHLLLTGPTGSGKTLLIRELAKLLKVPVAFASATSMVEAGYRGRSAEDAIRLLLEQSDGDAARAEMGIVFVDEIDKIARADNSGRDVSGEGVQNAFLTLLDGRPVDGAESGRHATVDTRKVLFICAGAFAGLPAIIRKRLRPPTNPLGFRPSSSPTGDVTANHPPSTAPKPASDRPLYELYRQARTRDFVEFGMIPEFMGRFATISYLHEMTPQDVRHLLASRRPNCPLVMAERMANLHGMTLRFTDRATDYVAERSVQSETGIRGLDLLVREAIEPLRFAWPELADNQVRCVEVDWNEESRQFEHRYEYGVRRGTRRDLYLRGLADAPVAGSDFPDARDGTDTAERPFGSHHPRLRDIPGFNLPPSVVFPGEKANSPEGQSHEPAHASRNVDAGEDTELHDESPATDGASSRPKNDPNETAVDLAKLRREYLKRREFPLPEFDSGEAGPCSPHDDVAGDLLGPDFLSHIGEDAYDDESFWDDEDDDDSETDADHDENMDGPDDGAHDGGADEYEYEYDYQYNYHYHGREHDDTEFSNDEAAECRDEGNAPDLSGAFFDNDNDGHAPDGERESDGGMDPRRRPFHPGSRSDRDKSLERLIRRQVEEQDDESHDHDLHLDWVERLPGNAPTPTSSGVSIGDDQQSRTIPDPKSLFDRPGPTIGLPALMQMTPARIQLELDRVKFRDERYLSHLDALEWHKAPAQVAQWFYRLEDNQIAPLLMHRYVHDLVLVGKPLSEVHGQLKGFRYAPLLRQLGHLLNLPIRSDGLIHGRYYVIGLLACNARHVVLQTVEANQYVVLKIPRGPVRASQRHREGILHAHREMIHSLQMLPEEYSVPSTVNYLAMEYCPGGSLRDLLLQNKGCLRQMQTLTLLRSATRTLGWLHRNEFLFNNLAPESLLVRSPNVIQPTISSVATVPQLGRHLPFVEHIDQKYAAPELLETRMGSEKADQFALAASFLEAFVGRRLTGGRKTKPLTQEAILRYLPGRHGGTALRLSDVLCRAVTVDPADRWPSLDAMYGALL